MTRKRGGGRESGAIPLHTARPVDDEGTQAAANPAAPEFQTPEWVRWARERIRELESERDSFREHWQFEYARAERAEADFAQLKELPPETCPKCGDVQHSGPCREFNPDDPEDWDELPKAVRWASERIRELEAEVAAHEDEGIDWRRGTKAALERIDQLTVRAERAEARVAELMPIIGAHHRKMANPAGCPDCREWQARERGELRGEDRG